MSALANSIGTRRSQRFWLMARIALLSTVACSGDGGVMNPAIGPATPTAGAPTPGAAGMGAPPTGAAGSTPGATGGAGTRGMTRPPGAGSMAMPTAGTVAMPDPGSTTDPGASADAGPGMDAGPGAGPGQKPAGDPMGWHDPGTGPFEEGTPEECKMDMAMLAANFWTNGAVFRYGKLCYSTGSIDNPYGVFSVTKTVAGTVMAAAYWETRENPERILPSDPVSKWGGAGSTLISEYAGMVASGSFIYDTLGTNLAVTRGPMEMSLSQGSVSGATSLDEVRDNLFAKLGVGGSWPTGTWGTGANISLTDMGRLGIVHAHGGWWNGEQVLDPDWAYWMYHPHHEDKNTSYGMYMWLNHRGNATGIGGAGDPSGAGPAGGDPCAPAAVWARYPHPPSSAPDCLPAMGNKCEQTYDTGISSAQGLGGQFIVIHRGLDLVMTAANYSGQGGPLGLWEAVRPALVAKDPKFMGDEAAFCAAYGAGDYAPDLIVEPVQPEKQ